MVLDTLVVVPLEKEEGFSCNPRCLGGLCHGLDTVALTTLDALCWGDGVPRAAFLTPLWLFLILPLELISLSKNRFRRKYMENHPTYSEEFQAHGYQWDRRTGNDFLQLGTSQSHFQSPEEQFSESITPIHARASEHAMVHRRHFIHSQHEKEDDLGSLSAALQSSPYLKPTQQLLDEVVCVSTAVEQSKSTSVRLTDRNGGHILPLSNEGNLQQDIYNAMEEKQEVPVRVLKLVALLNELENRYEQYFSRLDHIISSFEVVAGRGVAASYTALTIQAMSRHFLNLRDAIIVQIHASRESQSDEVQGSHRNFSQQRQPSQTMREKREDIQKLGMMQSQQVWRPLRGFPDDSVSVLRAWLFENFLHPYPNENEKLMLASRTGLTKNQISNWFINARVRLWKPMIEEMYREEFPEESENLSSS